MDETHYPKLMRPRKLCFLGGMDKPKKQCGTLVGRDDIDKMFDDFDSSLQEDVQSPPRIVQTFEGGLRLNSTEVSPIPKEVQLMVNEADHTYPVIRSSSPKLDVVLQVASVQQSLGVKHSTTQHNKNAQIASPLLFHSDDEFQEKAQSPPPATPTKQCNKQVTEKIALSEPIESLPSKATSTKKCSQKKTPGKSRRREKAELPVFTVTHEPELEVPEKKSESVPRPPPAERFSHPVDDRHAFLQKLKLMKSGQPKAPCPRQPVLEVEIPAPPEPEDDFDILEDNVTFQFSIPKKCLSRREKQSRSSSTDKDNATEKGSAKENSPQMPQNQVETEKANDKPESQIVDEKTKKKKRKKKKSKVAEPETDEERLPIEKDKPNRKEQQLKTGQSKERDEPENQPEESSSAGTGAETPAQKLDKITQTPAKSKKSSNEKREKNSTTRTMSSKGNRKGPQGKDAVKETVEVVAVEQQSELHSLEPVDTEELPSPEKELVNSDTNGTTGRKKPPSRPGRSLSEDSQLLGKRKRKPVGEWWLNTQETADQQPTVKKLKENKAAASSPARKDKFVKRRKQRKTQDLSCQHPKNVKENKNKQNNKGKGRKDSSAEKKTTDVVEEEQQEVPDADQDHASPLIFTHRDNNSSNSGDQILKRVDHHSHIEKLSTTPAASDAPGQQMEQTGEAQPVKRRKKPTGNWWMVNNNVAEDVGSSSLPQLQRQTTKPRKERRKSLRQSKSPGLTCDGKSDASSNPAGGAPVPPLKIKPLFTPKTVKRSLAKFTDIFTSGIDTPRVVGNRDTEQRGKRKVLSRPAEKKAAKDSRRSSQSNTDADEQREHNPEPQPEDGCQTDSMSKVLRSGPCSMLELDDYDDMGLSSSRFQSVLSLSDLCGPPLRPLVLQPKDSDNLALWFKSLWSTISKNDTAITPEQFDWYFYQDRAMGLQTELHTDSICAGKILLGSHMQKPLWVDHYATTVFHLLTSSVSVTIGASESRVGPGHSFMVNSGHAYSIKNTTAQPAVLNFTRIRADSLD